MIIGLMGCLINNENMGCVALTFSLINMLEKISEEKEEQFTYYIFEVDPDEICRKNAVEKLGLRENQIKCFDVRPLFRFRRFAHHILRGMFSIRALSQCDYVIDLTAGDSFTDIYGQYTFDSETNVKLLVKKMRKSLILGPQTYGPFSNKRNIKKAKKAIESADLVIARDQKSADGIEEFSSKNIYVTTDLAFKLPWNVEKSINSNKVKVGINISGLLLNNKTESTALLVERKTDYDTYICRVIDWLLDEKCYDIYVIPHVGKDGEDYIKKIYGEQIHYFKEFKDPISAKTVISQMDIFIGARMHATVAAFSSGVATIPTAYSRKFAGLYSNLGYPYTIDLVADTTESNVGRTIQYICDYKDLKKAVQKCMDKVEIFSTATYSLLLKNLK